MPLLDDTISIDLARRFYKGIRCGILHQGQTKENTALTYQLDVVFEKNGPYYLCNPKIVFEKIKKAYKEYWEEISEKNYSDEESAKLIKKYESILKHIE